MANNLSKEFALTLMSEALFQAELAFKKGEVPVGAVVAIKDNIIARSHNLVEQEKDPSAHAEILALKEAGKVLGDWRLNEAILCVTLEPCTMCTGAIRQSRIGTVIFGASDPKMGAMGSLYDISQDLRLGEIPRVIRNIKAERCAQVLKDFFNSVRTSKSG